MKNGVRIVAGLVLLVIPLLIPVGEGRSLAPAEKWVARYNGPGNGEDRAQDIAVDGLGNVYVTGITGYLNNEEYDIAGDYATIKYNSNGKQLWVQRYDGPAKGYDEARAIAVDSSGNVYVTGCSYGLSGSMYREDFATIKYSPNGKQLWVKRYNGPGNSVDGATAIAVDGSGNVYVTGSSEGSGTDYDYATIKYNTNGKQLWVARYNGPGNSLDGATAIAVDGSGNVYVTGYSEGSGYKTDYATIKYGTNGKQLWVARYNGPGNYYDLAMAIAIDGSGNVYVTGYSHGSRSDFDYATIKYNTNGKQLWVQRYDGPAKGYDEARAIAVDKSGNVYVTGSSSYDYATIKYGPNGKQLWVKRYNGPGNDYDGVYAIALDGSGNVYVTGESKVSGTDNDYATIKYNTNGKQLWVKRYDGPSKGYDGAQAIAVDKSGNVYVTGGSYGSGTDYDYATVKY